MKALRNFFNAIVRKDSPESSKRLIALVVSTLFTGLTVYYTNSDNFLEVQKAILWFLFALLGLSSGESVYLNKTKGNDSKQT